MDSKNNNHKYRISVLLDLSKSAELVLKNTVQLAKKINGSIEVFHVKPADIIKGDSQLSAIRTLHQDDRITRAKLEEIINSIGKEENLRIDYKLEYGNVKNRVRDYLVAKKPDILVLGKRKSKIGILGESITDFVINHANTNILILGDDDKLHSFQDISVGIFGNDLKDSDLAILQDLKRDSQKPVRLFNIKEAETTDEPKTYPWQETISYVFAKGTNALDGLTSYVGKTDTELLCIPKSKKRGFAFKTSTEIEVLRKTKVPLLIMA